MQEKKNIKKKVSDILFFLITLLLCVCIIGLLRGNAPAFFGYRILNVISGSMEPEIRTGSYIIIRKTNSDELSVGDIITFVSREPAIYGMYNTHRIYDICKDTYTGETLFITKGDAYTETDAFPVHKDEIVGKLVKVLPLGRPNNHVYFLIIIVPLLVCLISYVVQLIKTLRSRDDEEES